MHVYIHTQAREEIVFPKSLENLWDSTAGNAFLLFKENLRKKLMCSQKLPALINIYMKCKQIMKYFLVLNT